MMKRDVYKWEEITLGQMCDLAKQLKAVVTVDGDSHTVIIEYEG